MVRTILAVLFLVANGVVLAAGQANNFSVENVRIDKNGYGFIKFVEALQGTPATCISGGHTSHLAFDANTAGGRGILSLALSAQAAGKKIYAVGTGTCDQYGVVESWSYGWVIGP